MLDTNGIIGCLPIQLEKSHQLELENLISVLPKISDDEKAENLNFVRFSKLTELYSEEPQLLDSVLPKFVSSLLLLIEFSSDSVTQPLSNLSLTALTRLQVLTRIRGYKTIIRLLPHEVSYLEKILSTLEFYANKKDVQQHANVVFMLLVWLLIICKNPFNLTKFDNTKRLNNTTQISVTERIVNCLNKLQDCYILQGEMAIISTLMAQILTRNDNNLETLIEKITPIIQIIEKYDSETNGGKQLISSLRFLIALFKWGKRNELKICAEILINSVKNKLLNNNCKNIEVRNLTTKLIQRITLAMLKPRLADWRYKCGYRLLQDCLKGFDKNLLLVNNDNVKKNTNEISLDENDYEIPYDIIKEFVNELLNKIKDRDNIVRWTSAKGLARICARLNQDLAGEIVTNVISSILNATDNASVWHGGCLALAEFCRRGCLLPKQIPQVIETVLIKAILFEQSQTSLSVSVSVRDAACYIIWAFSRAYETHILKNCLTPLAGNLVCLALFDREVNIRRAASAAFQENVGRNDCFPHGIQILNIINYADVSLIKNCYLNLSCQVAQYCEYQNLILNHLVEYKTQHWDESLRELTADAFELLVSFNSNYSKETIIPKLCLLLNDKNSVIKHGALFSISGLLMGLFKANQLFLNQLSQFNDLLNFVHKNRYLVENHRKKDFALLSKGFCRFIQAMCTIEAPLSNEHLSEYHDILDQVISDSNSRLHIYAINAFDAFMKCYNNQKINLLFNRIFNVYFPNIDNVCVSETIRSSSIIPLAYIPTHFLMNKIDNINTNIIKTQTLAELIITKLIKVIFDSLTPTWVYARVFAVKSITTILTKFVPQNFDFLLVINSLIFLSDDYTTTVNGDIGRFARKEAVIGLLKVFSLNQLFFQNFKPEIITKAFGKILQRCCESIDELRSSTCIALGEFLTNNKNFIIEERNLLNKIFVLNYKDQKFEDNFNNFNNNELNSIINKNELDNFKSSDWTQAKGFLQLQPLLESKIYKIYALEGFVLSTGSIAEWTSQSAYAAVAITMKKIKKDVTKLNDFLKDLLKIYENIVTRKNDVSPVLHFFRMLLNDRVFAVFEKNPEESKPFMDLTAIVIKISLERGKPKIKCLALSIIGCFLQFDQKSKLYRNSLSTIISFVESPYISLREIAVEQLYNALNFLDEDELNLNNSLNNDSLPFLVSKILKETQWTKTDEKDQITKAKQQLINLLLEKN